MIVVYQPSRRPRQLAQHHTCVICLLSWFPRISVILSGYLTCAGQRVIVRCCQVAGQLRSSVSPVRRPAHATATQAGIEHVRRSMLQRRARLQREQQQEGFYAVEAAVDEVAHE